MEYVKEHGGLVVEAPDARHEHSAVAALTEEDVARFNSATSWVPEAHREEVVKEVVEAPPEPRLRAAELYGAGDIMWQRLTRVEDRILCSIAHDVGGPIGPNLLVGTRGGEAITLHLCTEHLAELHFLEEGTTVSILADAPVLVPEAERGGVCQADLFIHHPNRRCAGEIAYILPYSGFYVCPGHAEYMRNLARQAGAIDPTLEIQQMVQSGELGSGRRQNQTAFKALFPRLDDGWQTRCKECGEALDAHWGLACPSKAPYVLAVDSPYNRLGVEARSRFEFTPEVMKALDEEVAALKRTFAEDREKNKDKAKLRGKDSFEEVVRRLVGADGTALDEPGGAREHWVVDTLRKFGRGVLNGTRCVDCGGKWDKEEGSHNGPDCVAQ